MDARWVVFLAALALFFGLAYGDACVVRASCNAGETAVFSLSAQGNAHAVLDPAAGPFFVCCPGPVSGASCDPDPDSAERAGLLFTLPDPASNAHGAGTIGSFPDYSQTACITASAFTPSCQLREKSACGGDDLAVAGVRGVASEADVYNAHFYDASSMGDDDSVLCCGFAEVPPSDCAVEAEPGTQNPFPLTGGAGQYHAACYISENHLPAFSRPCPVDRSWSVSNVAVARVSGNPLANPVEVSVLPNPNQGPAFSDVSFSFTNANNEYVSCAEQVLVSGADDPRPCDAAQLDPWEDCIVRSGGPLYRPPVNGTCDSVIPGSQGELSCSQCRLDLSACAHEEGLNILTVTALDAPNLVTVQDGVADFSYAFRVKNWTAVQKNAEVFVQVLDARTREVVPGFSGVSQHSFAPGETAFLDTEATAFDLSALEAREYVFVLSLRNTPGETIVRDNTRERPVVVRHFQVMPVPDGNPLLALFALLGVLGIGFLRRRR